MGFIYIWENKIDSKRYIGKCQGSPESSYLGSGKYFKRAVRKYGIENFERKIIELCDDPTELTQREQYWLDYYRAATDPMFYNVSPNAGGGHHGANYTGKNNPMWGKKHPNHRPHCGKDNGMYGVHRFGADNPNAKKVIITDCTGKEYKGNCLKEVCFDIFNNYNYYGRLKHMVNLCMRGSKPRKDSVFYGWVGKYEE